MKLDSTRSPTVSQTDVPSSSILQEFEDVFKTDIITSAKHFKHNIRWKAHATPVQYKVRNVPLAVRPALTTELQKLAKQGIIEPIHASEWVSPIVVVRKPDGEIRVCVDLRDVNSKIVVAMHPLPNIHEMLATVKNAKLFTTLDLSAAYHQIPLTEECKILLPSLRPTVCFVSIEYRSVLLQHHLCSSV
ncbi:Uncharacterised protein g9273 [Pycnogonum litorale]